MMKTELVTAELLHLLLIVSSITFVSFVSHTFVIHHQPVQWPLKTCSSLQLLLQCEGTPTNLLLK